MRYELTPCQLNRLNDYIRHLRLAACLIDTLVHDIAKDARPGLRGTPPTVVGAAVPCRPHETTATTKTRRAAGDCGPYHGVAWGDG